MRLLPALRTVGLFGLVFLLAALGCAKSGFLPEDASYDASRDAANGGGSADVETDSNKDSSTPAQDATTGVDSAVSACARDYSIKSSSDMLPLANCVSITGNLTVESPTLADLKGLSDVKSVNGDLNIWENAVLADISGLGNLASVTGGLAIRNNEALQELKGLASLTSVGGSLVIGHDNSLVNLDGLSGLTSVGALYVYDNAALTDIEGMSKLTSVKGELVIESNAALPTCQANALKKALVAKGYSGTASIAGNDDTATCP